MENAIQLKDINTSVIKKRVVVFDSSGNKAVYHNKDVRQVTGNIYIGEKEGSDYYAFFSVYVIFGDRIGLYLGHLNDNEKIDKVKELISYHHFDNFDNYIASIEDRIANNQWVNCVEMEYIKNYRPDLVANIEVARMAYKKKQEQKRNAREAERKAKHQHEMDTDNQQTEEIINNAIETIKHGGEVDNVTVKIWKNDECHSYMLINYICDKYGIKVPIRTRGFINDKLASIIISEDGKGASYRYFRRKNSKGSQTIYDIIYKIIDEVRNGNEKN